jgi:hypothetical protein
MTIYARDLKTPKQIQQDIQIAYDNLIEILSYYGKTANIEIIDKI